MVYITVCCCHDLILCQSAHASFAQMKEGRKTKVFNHDSELTRGYYYTCLISIATRNNQNKIGKEDRMDNISIVLKILETLEHAMDDAVFDDSTFTAQSFGITQERFERLLIQMQKAGYIEGLKIYAFLSDTGTEKVRRPMRPEITMKGLEYLSNYTVE